MGKISNFTIISLTIVGLIILVITYTTSKINNDHDEKLIYAMESKIKYYAKRCYLEDKCKDEITIQDLYDLGYLSEMVNPVTKEIVDPKTKLSYNNETKEITIG